MVRTGEERMEEEEKERSVENEVIAYTIHGGIDLIDAPAWTCSVIGSFHVGQVDAWLSPTLSQNIRLPKNPLHTDSVKTGLLYILRLTAKQEASSVRHC